MEIDFLGLNSSNYKLEQGNLKYPFLDPAGGVETSLSLSTSSSFNFSDKKKWEFASNEDEMQSSYDTICGLDKSHVTEQPSLLLVARPAFLQASGGGGFRYDVNDAATPNLRNLSLSAETNGYNTGNASNGISTGGHTPTVAMARRATLARFLEKRLHRMNQARTSHMMGKSLGATNTEACETTITRNNNNKTNDPRRR
ncbi:uncharacterized protein LOC121761130 isoform X2 [Salvia splendens]|uniref:uncharacterized protein LOC121761130 isoform X2 n=1 Tax=Salvia splendens TaxID=180675 RepID=UPI001C27B1A4|nr:uncharacterized protein LOC121761130 isoform X2 [Salvia splendens]